MSIYVTGDTHGEQSRFYRLDSYLKAGDILVICGDFGYLFLDDLHEHRFLDDLQARPYTILFVDGNHENFPAIYRYPLIRWNGGLVHQIRTNIYHLCRGQVYQMNGKTFFTFGGGYSIDKASRTPGYSWWKEELPTEEEMEEGRKNLSRHHWKVDYIITHTADVDGIKMLTATDRYEMLKPLDSEEQPLNLYLSEIAYKTQFQKWFFGHFHRDRELHLTRQRAVLNDVILLDDENETQGDVQS